MDHKNLDEIITGRRSIREFKNEEVPDKDILAIVNASRYAPSNGNVQPWYFIIVKHPKTKKELQTLIDIYYENKLNEWESDLKKIFKSFHSNVRLRDAPVYIFVFLDRNSAYNHLYPKTIILKDKKLKKLWEEATKQSVAGAIQNILLKAEDLGYSTCIIGGGYYLKEKITQFFDLPPNYEFYSIIMLGKRDQEPPNLPKKSLEEVLEFFPNDTEEVLRFLERNSTKIIKEHSIRVREIAKCLQKEIGGDEKVIEYAALLHDIAIKDGFEYHAERGSAMVYEEFKIKWRKNFLEEVCKCIKYHSINSPKLDNPSPEIICVYDADKIDFLTNMAKDWRIDEHKIYNSLIHPYSKEFLKNFKQENENSPSRC